MIDRIEENQDEDGYFNIYYTVCEPGNRFTVRENHELYCAGHLIEAAVAYFEACGDDRFLNIMRKYADYIYQVFYVEKSAKFTTPAAMAPAPGMKLRAKTPASCVAMLVRTADARDLSLFFENGTCIILHICIYIVQMAPHATPAESSPPIPGSIPVPMAATPPAAACFTTQSARSFG